MNADVSIERENDLEEFDDKYSEEEPEEIPKEIRKINTQAYDKSVSDIVRMIEESDINLNPEYQRNYIWDNKRASLLIESIILNVPIPVIYVSQEADDSWTVIDGLQRLYSIKRFFDREFRLNGLEVFTELNRSDIKTLNPKALRILKNGLLRIIVISSDSHEEIKYDVFMRLNRGSVRLNEQELRNCLYRGSLNDLIKLLTENKQMLSLLNLKSPHKRMNDAEMILRFLAISRNWSSEGEEVRDYKGRMKSFLNTFMYGNKNPSNETLLEYRRDFENTINKVYRVYGDKAFRRINPSGEYETSVNRAIMDVLMLSSLSWPLEALSANKDKIVRRFNELVSSDTDFRNSITIATSDVKVMNYRLKRWCNELREIVE